MELAELAERFHYPQAQTDSVKSSQEAVRVACYHLASLLNERLPDGREKALALTKLESIMLWSNAALARQGEV